jgi:hypothetical protein
VKRALKKRPGSSPRRGIEALGLELIVEAGAFGLFLMFGGLLCTVKFGLGLLWLLMILGGFFLLGWAAYSFIPLAPSLT